MNILDKLKKMAFWYQFEKTANHCNLFSSNISKVTGFLSEKLDRVPQIKKCVRLSTRRHCADW